MLVQRISNLWLVQYVAESLKKVLVVELKLSHRPIPIAVTIPEIIPINISILVLSNTYYTNLKNHII